MDYWENFILSEEAQARLRNILSEVDTEFSNILCTLMDINRNDKCYSDENFCSKMDIDSIENNFKETENLKKILNEALEANTLISETSLCDLSSDEYFDIFSDVKNNIDELQFCTFCKSIECWENDVLVEQALKAVILPKLQEKKESSTSTIFSVTKLASAIPDKFCNFVLIPLVTDQNVYFSDVELMTNIFCKLPTACKDVVIMNYIRKCEFRDSDWLLLQNVTKELSTNGISMISKCIQKHSILFTKSQAFGKFLVSFCKNINFLDNKKLLFEAVNKHQTLLKRQALKFLEKI